MKYPRTYHCEWSFGATDDDKIVSTSKLLENFAGKRIIITEKRDGENTTIRNDKCHARSLDSNNHPSRDWVKGLWGNIQYLIPENLRICGENLYAKHSIKYTNLESYFEVFNIWIDDVCLDWENTVFYCNYFNLIHVPVLYDGIFDLSFIQQFHKNLDLNHQEGYVVRLYESFKYNQFQQSVFKWVRQNHVNTDVHWMSQKIIKNDKN